MFKQAVKNHNAAAPLSQNNGFRQQSLGNSFKTPLGTAQPKSTTTRPLALGSGNSTKHNVAAERRSPGQVHGIKRTSSGLAKTLGSQGELFDYPPLNIGDVENELPRSFHNSSQGNCTVQNPVYFDEGDFDSDIDLDLEDPSTKDTVSYPTATPISNKVTRASSSTTEKKEEFEIPEYSSQPIPWSSSPISHFRTPVRAPAQAPKRRTLPWNQTQNKPKFQAASKLEAALQDDPEPEFDIEETEEYITPQPKKRKFTEAKPVTVQATPAKLDPTKSQFPWNTTASAIKEKQKNLREQNKKTLKANEGTEDEVKKAVTKKKKNSVHRIFLSEEQQNVLNLVVESKKSVFFTGSAGTGKSVLLREIIAALRRKYIREPDRVAVVASTGLAACNIGGVTIHRFAGIGLGKEPAEELIKRIRRNPKAKQRWMRTKVLVIDEVSMVDGDLYDKLEQIARTLRNNGRPFGGIQLVITGDFFQLPPVPEFGRASKFAFDAGTWTTSIEHTIGLHHVFRQKDPVFANMLNEMREGRLSANSIAQFKKLDRPLPPSDDNIEATELFPTRQEVDRANNARMQQLHGSVFSFDAKDGGSITDKAQRDKLLESCMVPEVVYLKKGAQVMLVKNMDDTLVNGSLGKVTSFMTEEMFNLYKDNEEAFLDQNSTEGEGADNRMKQQILKASLGVNTSKVYPVVRFAIQDGTTRDLLCKPESWKIEQPHGQNPDVLASREQIPLILSWALSIHKAQGQTLERVRVDLGKVFEKGQAYVALSRATSMAGLQVMRFDHRKVLAHEKVRQFYSSLSRAEQVQSKEKGKTVLGKMMEKGKK